MLRPLDRFLDVVLLPTVLGHGRPQGENRSDERTRENQYLLSVLVGSLPRPRRRTRRERAFFEKAPCFLHPPSSIGITFFILLPFFPPLSSLLPVGNDGHASQPGQEGTPTLLLLSDLLPSFPSFSSLVFVRTCSVSRRLDPTQAGAVRFREEKDLPTAAGPPKVGSTSEKGIVPGNEKREKVPSSFYSVPFSSKEKREE